MNFYYENIKFKLIGLTIITDTMIIIQFTREIDWGYDVNDRILAYFYGNYHQNITVGAFILTLFIFYTSTIPFLIFAYFNIKNINFKVYLKDILKGYGLKAKYPYASIFVRVSDPRMSFATMQKSTPVVPQYFTSDSADEMRYSFYSEEYTPLKPDDEYMQNYMILRGTQAMIDSSISMTHQKTSGNMNSSSLRGKL